MQKRHIVVMGVSGSGKSTVARALSSALGLPFAEGDDVHSEANRARMAAGIPLTDEDRGPWLEALRDWMSAQVETGSVLSCSALRRSYRDVLRAADGTVEFVEMSAPPAVLAERMARRPGHFMPTTLLDSQLATLEPLADDEPGLRLTATGDIGTIVRTVVERLALRPAR